MSLVSPLTSTQPNGMNVVYLILLHLLPKTMCRPCDFFRTLHDPALSIADYETVPLKNAK